MLIDSEGGGTSESQSFIAPSELGSNLDERAAELRRVNDELRLAAPQT
jgi:hypothetical protein